MAERSKRWYDVGLEPPEPEPVKPPSVIQRGRRVSLRSVSPSSYVMPAYVSSDFELGALVSAADYSQPEMKRSKGDEYLKRARELIRGIRPIPIGSFTGKLVIYASARNDVRLDDLKQPWRVSLIEIQNKMEEVEITSQYVTPSIVEEPDSDTMLFAILPRFRMDRPVVEIFGARVLAGNKPLGYVNFNPTYSCFEGMYFEGGLDLRISRKWLAS